jgi:protein-S-isoprenylcysteine O-methyltransferase Ste14
MLTKIRVWFGRTPNRSFVVYPLVTVAIELGLGHGVTEFNLWGICFLAWGYSQYKFCGRYRGKYGGGGDGASAKILPRQIVDKGFFRYTRNPMYLGHIIFFFGLVITFSSWFAVALLIILIPWFDVRVRRDELTLEEHFGNDYLDYKQQVKRWIPYIY